MKLSSTIIFVPLTAALPAVPSALYTADQLKAIINDPNTGDVVKADAGITPRAENYKRDEISAAKVTRNVVDLQKSKAEGTASQRGVVAANSNIRKDGVATTIVVEPVNITGDDDGVPVAANVTTEEKRDITPNAQYPGAAEVETKYAGHIQPVGKVSMRKRLVRFMKRGVKTNSFCPKP